MKFYCDKARHLVCVPYSVANLHQMAEFLGIRRCWFHPSKSGEHYDIPASRIAEISQKCINVDSRAILRICRGEAP